jgi:hypothetical protein
MRVAWSCRVMGFRLLLSRLRVPAASVRLGPCAADKYQCDLPRCSVSVLRIGGALSLG